MSDVNTSTMSMREQFEGLLTDNEGKYPDAMLYLRSCLKKENIDEMMTEQEKFMGMLDGTYPKDAWSGCPHEISRDNIIYCIKWYRSETGITLRDAKAAFEDKYYRVTGTKY